MVDYFIRCYQGIISSNSLLNRLKIYSFARASIRLIANIIIPIYYKLTYRNKKYRLSYCNEINPEIDIVVSLTSFPARINRVWLAIESILRQKQKPNKIILYISKSQFGSINELPHPLLEQTKRGLEIIMVEGDIRSHKKYYYAFNSFQDAYIITIDDDVFYPSYLISNMINDSKDNPNTIIANVAKTVILHNNELTDYSKWPISNLNSCTKQNFLIGIGGVLYPPHSVNTFYKQKDLFMKLCPLADDIWLNAMAQLNNTCVFKSNSKVAMLPIWNRKPQNLHSVNVSRNQNNIQLKKTREYLIKKTGKDIFNH